LNDADAAGAQVDPNFVLADGGDRAVDDVAGVQALQLAAGQSLIHS